MPAGLFEVAVDEVRVRVRGDEARPLGPVARLELQAPDLKIAQDLRASHGLAHGPGEGHRLGVFVKRAQAPGTSLAGLAFVAEFETLQRFGMDRVEVVQLRDPQHVIFDPPDRFGGDELERILLGGHPNDRGPR